MEKVKARLREIPKNSVSYWEFVQICCETCGNNDEQGSQMAQSLDQAGSVVVLGDIVFLHPYQVDNLTTNQCPLKTLFYFDYYFWFVICQDITFAFENNQKAYIDPITEHV